MSYSYWWWCYFRLWFKLLRFKPDQRSYAKALLVHFKLEFESHLKRLLALSSAWLLGWVNHQTNHVFLTHQVYQMGGLVLIYLRYQSKWAGASGLNGPIVLNHVIWVNLLEWDFVMVVLNRVRAIQERNPWTRQWSSCRTRLFCRSLNQMMGLK